MRSKTAADAVAQPAQEAAVGLLVDELSDSDGDGDESSWPVVPDQKTRSALGNLRKTSAMLAHMGPLVERRGVSGHRKPAPAAATGVSPTSGSDSERRETAPDFLPTVPGRMSHGGRGLQRISAPSMQGRARSSLDVRPSEPAVASTAHDARLVRASSDPLDQQRRAVQTEDHPLGMAHTTPRGPTAAATPTLVRTNSIAATLVGILRSAVRSRPLSIEEVDDDDIDDDDDDIEPTQGGLHRAASADFISAHTVEVRDAASPDKPKASIELRSAGDPPGPASVHRAAERTQSHMRTNSTRAALALDDSTHTTMPGAIAAFDDAPPELYEPPAGSAERPEATSCFSCVAVFFRVRWDYPLFVIPTQVSGS